MKALKITLGVLGGLIALLMIAAVVVASLFDPNDYKGYATEALHAVVDYAFTDLGHTALQAGARVTNPASRRVLEKCGFQWTGVGLYRIRAINSSAPIDRFRLERGIWSAIKGWGRMKRVS